MAEKGHTEAFLPEKVNEEVLINNVLQARELIPSNIDSARVLLQGATAIENSRKLRYKADYYNTMGLYYWFADKPQPAIRWYSRTLQLPDHKSISKLKAAAANNSGVLYHRIGKPDSTRYFLNLSLEIDIKAGNKEGMAKTLYDLSNHHLRLNQYELALQDILSAIDIQEQLGDKVRLAHSYNSLGNTYSALDSIDRARQAYTAAIRLAEESGVLKIIPAAYNNLAASWSEVNDGLEKTRYYVEKGLVKARELNDISTTVALYTNLGIAHSHSGMSQQAIVYFDTALDMLDESDLPLKEVDVTYRLGNEYLILAELSKSRKFLEQSRNIAVKIQSLSYRSLNLFGLARLDSIQGDYLSYARNFTLATALRDSIWNQKRLARLDELNLFYETENKNRLINELALKEKTVRLRFLVTATLALAIILSMTLVILYQRKKAALAHNQYLLEEKSNELIRAELNAKRQELAIRLLSLIRMEDVIKDLNKKVNKLADEQNDNGADELKKIVKQIRQSANAKELLKEFEQRFNELNDGFITKLVEHYPNLSPSEIRLCSMLRLQFTSKEIARLTHRSSRTIDYTRNSIRRKMQLPTSANLTTHLLSI